MDPGNPKPCDASPEAPALDAPDASETRGAPQRVITTLGRVVVPAIALGAAGAKAPDPEIRKRIAALIEKARRLRGLSGGSRKWVTHSLTYDAAVLVAMGAKLDRRFGARRRRRIRAIAARLNRSIAKGKP